MNVISFSLWGDKPFYLQGALENIKLVDEIYNGWKCRFYVDKTVPVDVVRQLINTGSEVKLIQNNLGPYYGMFWRFFAADDPNVDVFISRDCDSRINYREKAAVDEWLKSDKCLHTMHDHYAHRSVPILGGMWGLKNGVFKDMAGKIAKWGRYDCKGIDQHFLAHSVWRELNTNCIRHGGHPSAERWGKFNQFPTHQILKFGGTYVGEIFDEKNNPVLS